MAVCTMSFWGESLDKECSMNLILPDRVKTRKQLCVLYQLHGLTDDHTGWLRRKGGQEPFVRSTLRAYRQKVPDPVSCTLRSFL